MPVFVPSRGSCTRDGIQLSLVEAVALCFYVGWREAQITTAVAIMTPESARWSGNCLDWHGCHMRGLFQINSCAHPDVSDAEAFNGLSNARAAYRISGGGHNWGPWTTYGGAGYRETYPLAQLALRERHWVPLVARVPEWFRGAPGGTGTGHATGGGGVIAPPTSAHEVKGEHVAGEVERAARNLSRGGARGLRSADHLRATIRSWRHWA